MTEETKEIAGEKLRFVDLFCGTGAFTLALENTGKLRCVLANDIEESSRKIYELNNHHKHPFILKDITSIKTKEIPKHDILCAGFPCQPFSVAGNRKGFDDKRSNVFWKIVEILKEYEPKIILLENVKNLKTHDRGKTYKTIEKALMDIGYHLKLSVLDTAKISGIPHHRERIYIVGFIDKVVCDNFNFDFPEIPKKPIIDMLEENVADKYYYTDRFKVYSTIEDSVSKNIKENVVYQYRRFYVRENKSNCCPTLTANMGSGGHNVPLLRDHKGVRKLTPRECFNLQGFPKNYKLPEISDSSLYKLAGNAVSVPVVSLIVEKLTNSIQKHDH